MPQAVKDTASEFLFIQPSLAMFRDPNMTAQLRIFGLLATFICFLKSAWPTVR